MITYRTQFPLNPEHDIHRVLDAGRVWIANSPHYALSGVLSGDPEIVDGTRFSLDDESMTFRHYEADEQLASFRFEVSDSSGVRWVTEVAAVKQDDKMSVSIQLSADAEQPLEKLGQGKAPYIVKVLLRDIGGGKDGALTVSDRPYYLDEDEVDLAASLINGTAQCQLPIVYVSANNDNSAHVHASQLAGWLAGMAHVIVEPSRDFSFRLMPQVYNENAYGGAVAIYWPDGMGKWSFMPVNQYADPKVMQGAITAKLRNSLLYQRLKSQCRWGYIQEKVAKAKLEALKASGSDQVADYIELFDTEIAAKDEEIHRLESEIARLKYGSFNRSDNPIQDGAIALISGESDLYQAERLALVMEALVAARDSAEPHSRRSDILSDLIEQNCSNGERESILTTLKAQLRAYKSMSSATRQSLEGLGFAVHEDGKHYKLIFRGDERYSFTLAKTGSDSRGGLNSYSDLKKRLF
ncbi:hypothetical protein KUW19_03160 [Ferrimonas balearica]|uniref:hypothetical protein n=1 Tax=Ferrimonas balearica TaxID=44012 RepID=UPI001C964A3A|nr:hypothetical protein [Ferrimonas balearica]MBY6105485.1 hypothetical protein [Ferrimonas balearica]